MILFYGLQNQESVFFPVMFLVAKIGNSSFCNLAYACCPQLFEVKRAVRVMGIAGFFARAFTSFAPLLSTLPQPAPTIIFCLTSIASGVLSFWIKEPARPGHLQHINDNKVAVCNEPTV